MLETTLVLIILALIGYGVVRHRQHKQEVLRVSKRNHEVRREALLERDQLLDALSDAFLLVSESCQITFANANAKKLVNGRKLVGRSIMEAFLDDRLSVAIMKCIRTGKPMQESVTNLNAHSPLGASDEGGRAWIIDAAPMENDTTTRVVIRDVSAEHQADQVRRDFVANASHELRTPMAIINGYLENLLDDDVVEDPELSRRFLETMRKHGSRISRLVEDMLVISKMESGEALSLSQDEFSIKSCIDDVCERLEAMIGKQDATVDIEIDPEALSLLGDRFYWTQIMFNLVENALKQNPSPGLTLSIRAFLKDKSTCIEVSDNGIGIPSADLPYIFKRFFRVDKHHTQSAIKGTGLGLSIVRRAIEAHGGTITARSTPGEETTFTIMVPVAEKVEGSAPQDLKQVARLS